MLRWNFKYMKVRQWWAVLERAVRGLQWLSFWYVMSLQPATVCCFFFFFSYRYFILLRQTAWAQAEKYFPRRLQRKQSKHVKLSAPFSGRFGLSEQVWAVLAVERSEITLPIRESWYVPQEASWAGLGFQHTVVTASLLPDCQLFLVYPSCPLFPIYCCLKFLKMFPIVSDRSLLTLVISSSSSQARISQYNTLYEMKIANIIANIFWSKSSSRYGSQREAVLSPFPLLLKYENVFSWQIAC